MFPVRARHKLRVSERMWGRDAGPFEGNDIRIRGGVLKRCVLCGSLTWLRLSHVIPKWAFRWHKNARGGVITTHLYSRVLSQANKMETSIISYVSLASNGRLWGNRMRWLLWIGIGKRYVQQERDMSCWTGIGGCELT